jgi:hypothetical protein
MVINDFSIPNDAWSEVTTRGLGKTGNETALMSRINTDPSFGSAAIDLRARHRTRHRLATAVLNSTT